MNFITNVNKMKLLKILPILLLFLSCSSSDEDYDDCNCIKTTYERLVINGSLTVRIVNTENVDCQSEGSQDIDNTHYYTVRCD